MSIDTFVEMVRMAVGAKSAGWRDYSPGKVECFWSWKDHGISFLYRDDIFKNPPSIASMVEKIRERQKVTIFGGIVE